MVLYSTCLNRQADWHGIITKMLPLLGDLGGRTAADLPRWCDLSLQPFGDAEKAQGIQIHVVWAGKQTGLFYSRYEHQRQHASKYATLTRLASNDVVEAIEGLPFATYATFNNIDEARVGWYLGPVLAGGDANRATMDKWIQAQGEPGRLVDMMTAYAHKGRRVKVLRQEPREIIEISDSEDSDDDSVETLSSSERRSPPPRKRKAAPAGEPEASAEATDSYYTFCGLPLAPAGKDHPRPIVHRVHVDALLAALKNRAKLVWVVVRGEAPGVYEDP